MMQVRDVLESSPMTIADAQARRLVRRYALSWDWGRRAPVAVVVGGCVGLTVVGTAAGMLMGATSASPGATATTAVYAVALVVSAVVIVGAPPRHLLLALSWPKAWALPMSFGVSVWSFVIGRYLLLEVVKIAVVILGLAALFVGLALTGAGAAAPSLGILLTGALAVAVALSALRIVLCLWAVDGAISRPRPRSLVIVGLMALAGVALPALILRAGYARAGTAAPLGFETVGEVSLALGADPLTVLGAASVALLVPLVLGLAVVRRLRALDWADVLEWSLASGTLRAEPATLPTQPLRAIVVTDLRRVARSRGMRLRPLVNIIAFYALLAVVAVTWWATGQSVPLPESLPAPVAVSGLVALCAIGLMQAAAPLAALDADRHALRLWLSIATGVERVAAARSAELAVIGFVPVLLLAPAMGMLGGTITYADGPSTMSASTLVVGCALVGAVGVASAAVLHTLASLVWPAVDWADVTEIGSSSPYRYAVDFVVPIPMVPAVAAVQQLHLDLSAPAVILVLVALTAVTPVVAGLTARALAPTARRLAHA